MWRVENRLPRYRRCRPKSADGVHCDKSTNGCPAVRRSASVAGRARISIGVFGSRPTSRHAALKSMRKLLKKYAFAPERLVTDDLRSYGSAARELGLEVGASAGDGSTIERRIHINRLGVGAQQRPLSPEVPFNPRCRLQHFQRPTLSQLSPNPTPRFALRR
jgi:hypothetical protein